MRRRETRPDKTVFQGLVIALFACLVTGCDDGPAKQSAFESPRENVATQRQAARATQPPPVRGADWGDDWRGPDRARSGTGARPGSGRATADRPTQPTTFWTLVLQTFPHEGHRQAAATMVRELRMTIPQLTGARVHTTSSGSMVIYGTYESAEDPLAQRDKDTIKNIKIGNPPRQAFPRAMLTRIRLQPIAGIRNPHDLMALRQRHPNVDPLYTLQVAVWGDFDSGTLTLAQIHRKAESYTAQLRAQGLEAYFYHDDDKQLSIVTIGAFDRRAIDPQTSFFSPEVEALIKRFPKHLVNGEPLLEKRVDRNRRQTAQPQTPRLVEVPKM